MASRELDAGHELRELAASQISSFESDSVPSDSGVWAK